LADSKIFRYGIQIDIGLTGEDILSKIENMSKKPITVQADVSSSEVRYSRSASPVIPPVTPRAISAFSPESINLKKVYDLAKSVGDAVEKYSTVIDAKLRGAQEVIGRVEKDAARVESATKRVVDAGSEVAATVGKVAAHAKSTYEAGKTVVTSARDVGQSVLNLDFFRKFDNNIESTSVKLDGLGASVESLRQSITEASRALKNLGTIPSVAAGGVRNAAADIGGLTEFEVRYSRSIDKLSSTTETVFSNLEKRAQALGKAIDTVKFDPNTGRLTNPSTSIQTTLQKGAQPVAIDASKIGNQLENAVASSVKKLEQSLTTAFIQGKTTNSTVVVKDENKDLRVVGDKILNKFSEQFTPLAASLREISDTESVIVTALRDAKNNVVGAKGTVRISPNIEDKTGKIVGSSFSLIDTKELAKIITQQKGALGPLSKDFLENQLQVQANQKSISPADTEKILRALSNTVKNSVGPSFKGSDEQLKSLVAKEISNALGKALVSFQLPAVAATEQGSRVVYKTSKGNVTDARDIQFTEFKTGAEALSEALTELNNDLEVTE
jgi:hypothetical protein